MNYQIPYGFTDLDVNGLVYASYMRNLDLLRSELASGTDPNSVDSDGVSAIAYASSEKGFVEGVRLLLEAGADPLKTGTRRPFNAIRGACSAGHLDILQLYKGHLLDRDALLSLFPNKYSTEIYRFLGEYLRKTNTELGGEQLELVLCSTMTTEVEVQFDAVIECIPLNFSTGLPLHIYVQNPDVRLDISERLLAMGCDPNVQDANGSTALKLLRNSEHWQSGETKAVDRAIRKAGGRYRQISTLQDLLRCIR